MADSSALKALHPAAIILGLGGYRALGAEGPYSNLTGRSLTDAERLQRQAIGLIAPEFGSSADTSLIEGLLQTAAGEPSETRRVSAGQMHRLNMHRVVSLLPDHWEVLEQPSLAAANEERKRLAMVQLGLESRARQVIDKLEAASIETRVLKGLATGRLDYVNPSQRLSSDIDLLVRHRDLPRAMSLIGGRAIEDSPDEIRFLKGPTLQTSGGLEVDLHYRLSRYFKPNVEPLFSNPVAIDGLGNALPAELRLIHAASHLILTRPGRRRLSGLADISAIRSRQTIDLAATQRLARKLDLERIAGFGLSLERHIRRLPDDVDWPKPSLLERMSYARAKSAVPMEHVFALATLPQARDRLAYLWYRLGTVKRRVSDLGG